MTVTVVNLDFEEPWLDWVAVLAMDEDRAAFNLAWYWRRDSCGSGMEGSRSRLENPHCMVDMCEEGFRDLREGIMVIV